MAKTPKAKSRSKSPAKKPARPGRQGRGRSRDQGPGRPSGYRPEHCDLILKLGTEGKSKAQMARSLGVARQTLDNWAEAHTEFLDALTRARDLSLAWWEEQLEQGIWSKEFNATAYAFAMKNRFPDDYRDKHEHKVDAKLDINLDEVRNGIADQFSRVFAAADQRAGRAAVPAKP